MDHYCRTECDTSEKYAPVIFLSRGWGGGLWWPAGLLFKKYFAQNNLKLPPRPKERKQIYNISLYGLTILKKPNFRQLSTNDLITTQNICNTAVSTSVEFKINTHKLLLCVSFMPDIRYSFFVII